MEAKEVRVNDYFDGRIQFRIPKWQRRYVWGEEQWQELLEDVVRLLSLRFVDWRVSEDQPTQSSLAEHFMGSVVIQSATASRPMPGEAEKYLVIDGQQRLTTLTILLAALRDNDVKAPHRGSQNVDVTNTYLVNANLSGVERSRLVLQPLDNDVLSLIVGNQVQDLTAHSISDAYWYFRREISKLIEGCPPKSRGVAASNILGTVTGALTVVWVRLEASDNAHRVFQTINAGGKPLNQEDIVRNFFFLSLGEGEGRGEQFYDEHWMQAEERLSTLPRQPLRTFLQAWTVSQGYPGTQSRLFQYFESELRTKDSQAVYAYGVELVKALPLFLNATGVGIEEVADKSVRRQLQLIAMTESHFATLYGVLVLLKRQELAGRLTRADHAKCLTIILGYLIRRFAGGQAPNLHNSIFARLARELATFLREYPSYGSSLPNVMRHYFSRQSDTAVWPSDEQVKGWLGTQPVYTKSRRAMLKVLLAVLNDSQFSQRRQAPNLVDYHDYTIEHVMVQKLNDSWIEDLGRWGVFDAYQMHSESVHLIGNLTLTLVNSELGRLSFAEKCAVYSEDPKILLSRAIANASQWTNNEINVRSREMASRLCEIVTGPFSQSEFASVDQQLHSDYPAVFAQTQAREPGDPDLDSDEDDASDDD